MIVGEKHLQAMVYRLRKKDCLRSTFKLEKASIVVIDEGESVFIVIT
jgi:hypothetical protein